MKTQYITEDVLIRPLESTSTRFLSSRYYNGKKILDSLESPESAEHWFSVNAKELSTTPAFPITERDISMLRSLRSNIEALYVNILESRTPDSLPDINTFLASQEIVPQGSFDSHHLRVTFTRNTISPLDEFMVEVVLSAFETLSPPQVFRLHHCNGPNCVLFYTKLRDSQHWCSNTCGNRARVARHASKHS